MTNQELRARTAILPEFASMAMTAGEQLQDAQLSKGFVPMELQPLVDEAITGAAPTFSDRPLTDLELSTLDTWFVAHPEKIAGTQIAGSGYIAPIRTRGNMEDLERVFAFLDEKESKNEFQYLIDKASRIGGNDVKGSNSKKFSLSDTESVILYKTIARLEAKAVAQNSALFDEKEPINTNYEKINGKEQKINTYNVDGYEIKYKYNQGKSFTEITTPKGDFIVLQQKQGKTEVALISEPVLDSQTANETVEPKPIDKAKIKAKAKAKASAAALRLKRKNETV